MKRTRSFTERYPPSDPCGCEICVGCCARHGWWTVEEAARAFGAGHGSRIVLEMAPEGTFGVLSPAFRGCEGTFAAKLYSASGCTCLEDGRCELHGASLQPLECRTVITTVRALGRGVTRPYSGTGTPTGTARSSCTGAG